MEKLQPNLRFPEFEEELFKSRLGEIATFSKGKGISKNDITSDGKNECIRYGELYTTYGEVINQIVSKTNVSKSSSVLSEVNDILIPSSGETQLDIAKSSCVLKSDVILGGDLNIIKTNNNGVFISYYLNSAKKEDIAKMAQGNSVVHLYSHQLSSLVVSFPTLPEQTKIASFLTTVDEKIAGLKKQHTLLERYKKGVMQKIFSQELRFKPAPNETSGDENGNEFPDWEEKKLGEICVKKSSNISANKIEDNYGEYIIYGASGVLKKVDFYQEENDYVSIVKDGAGVGRLLYCKGFSSVLGTLEMICPKGNLNTYFLYCLLLNIDFTKYVTGSTIPHIYFKDYSLEKCFIPSLPEQQKIATFLSSIDEKIEKCQGQIKKMENWKKGLLLQMFC